MDFFSILQKNSNENKKLNENPLTPKDKIDTKKEKVNQLTSEKVEVPCRLTTSSLKVEHTNSYKNIRRGDYVKIIGVKNSILNNYKGYIGEVRDYKKDQDFAIIFLHCNYNRIKFPIDHFIIIDN